VAVTGLSLVRILLALGLFGHGFAHLVGFVVPWRLATLDEAPYRTTLLGGRLKVGDKGIRLVGVLWLLAALAFGVSAAALLWSQPWWHTYTVLVSVASLVLCVLGWPDSRLGIPINVAILLLLGVGSRLGWLGIG